MMNKDNRNRKKKSKNNYRNAFSEDDDSLMQRNKHLNKVKRGNKNFED